MTALQLAGVGACAFVAIWNALLIRSARRQLRWSRAQARFLHTSHWGTRCRLSFILPDGTEVMSSSRIDADGPFPAPGNAVAIVYDPANPARCEPAMTAGEIAVLRLLAFAAMAGGVVVLVWA